MQAWIRARLVGAIPSPLQMFKTSSVPRVFRVLACQASPSFSSLDIGSAIAPVKVPCRVQAVSGNRTVCPL
jgi:hypothetical protein